MAQAQPAQQAPPSGVDGAVVELVRVLQQAGRTDLAERATAAGARLKRPSTVVCIVGEFKQGKSSLVNGLLGTSVCPVDDDLATSAITLVRFGEEPAAVVRRRVDGEQKAERIPIEQLHDYASETGNPGNEKGVERVEIAVPSAILRQGLVLVDTPGMGGLGAGHAAATLAFLPFADGLLLTSDASAELSAPEVDFLRRATELCPTVLFVQTKTDLYPAWKKIFDLNKGHLDRQGIDIPMVAVSSQLRLHALATKDREQNEQSQFPALIQALGDGVVTPAKENAQARSAADVRGIVALVRSGLVEEQKMLADPKRLQASIAELNAAKERLEHLRGPGARWSIVVGDRINDMSSRVNYEFRGAMRTLSRQMDEQIEVLSKGDDWDEMTRQLQSDVAEQVTKAFVNLEQGRRETREEVAGLLQEEHLKLGASHKLDPMDVEDLWQGKPIEEQGKKGRRMAQSGLVGIRGAQSGVMMFGMMGQFLPTAAATLFAANPVLLGAGAVFGGMQLVEDRKRKVQMRRQSARQQVRQFLDDVQFEIGNSITNLVRDIQRELRDEFTQILGELQRTYTETAQRAQQQAQATQQEQQQRGQQIAQQLQQLDGIDKMAASAT